VTREQLLHAKRARDDYRNKISTAAN